MDTKVLALIALALATLAFYRLYHTSCLAMEEDEESGEAQWYRMGMIASGAATVVLAVMVYQSSNKCSEVLTEPFDTTSTTAVDSL